MSAIIRWVINYLAGIDSSTWRMILQYIIAAEEKATEGMDKKAWVLDKLKNLGIKGSWANLAVEYALAWLKKQGTVNRE